MNFAEVFTGVLGFCYSISSVVRIWFYVPQIRAVKRSVDAAAIHTPTWMVWSVHNVFSALYGAFIGHDIKVAGFFAVSSICTIWVALTARKKQIMIQKDDV